MSIYAIADVHLSHTVEKPMEIFGSAWEDHTRRLEACWKKTVADGDLVLIPGDISWAMQLEDAKEDLAFLDALPGKKLLLRGNHDYWWSSYTKVKQLLPDSIGAIQNNAVLRGNVAIGGTRGWTSPNSAAFSQDDRKIYERELGRLRLSLAAMPEGCEKLVMLHYPPLDDKLADTPFTLLLEEYGVCDVVYGHLHGPAHHSAFSGVHHGVRYHFASADYLSFCPLLIRKEQSAP